jgi:hypothetical protein
MSLSSRLVGRTISEVEVKGGNVRIKVKRGTREIVLLIQAPVQVIEAGVADRLYNFTEHV